MIVSASRRTDIPARFAPWLMARLREGCALTRNPRNAAQVFRVSLKPADVDMLVFWSKNPAPLLPHLDEIDALGLPYYFSYSITAYDDDLEPGLPAKEKEVETFLRLADRLGPARVDWRYDPILLSDAYPIEEHLARFSRLYGRLRGHTERCILSFVDPYRHTAGLYRPVLEAEARLVAANMARIAPDLPLFACAEEWDLADCGVARAACIDPSKIMRLTGKTVSRAKDRAQRPLCGCCKSVDIGAYDTCLNGCLYCYANGARLRPAGDPASPLFQGTVPAGATIRERKS